jgi:competence protein ComEC
MIKSCLSLLAGAYALHFTSFTSGYGLFPVAGLGAAIALLAGGRGAAAWFLTGLSLFALHAQHVVAQRLPPQYEGDSMLAVLQIVDFPRQRGESISFLARPLGDPRIPPRLRISWYEAPERPDIGDVWQFEVRLRRPRGTSNPGQFDYEAWLFRQRIGATGYVVNGPRNKRLKQKAGAPASRLRQRAVERLASLIEDPDTSSVLAAISVGARHGITAEQWLRYSRSGTSHLMAISGLHVGLAASAAWFLAVTLCGVLRVGGNHLRIAWLAALVVAAGYAGLSGFAVPAKRATLMLLLLVLAFMRCREPRPVAILAAACFLVTGLDPLVTLAPGFQLSFAAVLILLWFARRRARAPALRLSRGVMQLAAVQAFLLFGLMPLTVMNFSRVSFAAPAVNLIAVPLFSIVTVPFALAGVLLDGPAAAAGDVALRIAGVGIEVLHWLVDAGLSFPHAVVVRTRQRTLLYDTGAAFPGGSDMASRVILPYLSAQGVQRIDRLVVSHSDIDHAGGAAPILAGMEVGQVLAGEPEALTAAVACRAGRAWHWDGVGFSVLHPPGNGRYAGNDASCVVLVEAGNARLLLTGDIESGVERALVAAGAPGRVDVVVVPHHGSDTSSSGTFVGFMSADAALVSAGHGNRWGLPKQGVVERWRDAGAEVMTTSHDGAIGIRLCDRSGIVHVSKNRQQRRRVWHEPPPP